MEFAFLLKNPLFRDISAEEIEQIIGAKQAFVRVYKKRSLIISAGETTGVFGFILNGKVNIERYDLFGNANMLAHVGAGDIFAETYACIPEEKLMVNVLAGEDCQILFIDMEKILRLPSAEFTYKDKLIRNLLILSSKKNLTLSRKIFHTSAKTIRNRVLSYLTDQAVLNKSRAFSIPLDRQQLANYLNVERSALSNELGKMSRDGLIEVNKNYFVLKSGKSV